MTTLTIVIPCFNEKESLSDLIKNIKILNNKIKFIILENGSSDGSYEYLNKIKGELPNNIVVHFKKENTGYGSGVYEGLNKIQNSKYIGWIHGDLQFEFTKLNQTYVELKNIENKYRKVFYKGIRTGRSNTEKFISLMMGFIASLVLKEKFTEINAQPTIFSYDLLEKIDDPPNDFSFDTYVYWLALKNDYRIIRKNFDFPPRVYGNSKWNFGIKSRLIFGINLFKYFLELRIKPY